MSAKAQRLRVAYSRGADARFIAHLDMMRFWERALRRAQIRVSYSEGFTPHAQVALAAPLSVGMSSRGELMDVFLSAPLSVSEFQLRLQAQLPPSITILTVEEVYVSGPSLQAQVRTVDYRIALSPSAEPARLEEIVVAFLASESFPWEHRREKDVKRYDLRPLVVNLRVDLGDESPALVATLRSEETGTARPDQLASALGLSGSVTRIERLRLNLAESEEDRG